MGNTLERSKFMSVTISAKILPILERHAVWKIAKSGHLDDPLFSFTPRPWPITQEGGRRYSPRIPDLSFDAFRVREEFFAIRSPDQAEAFLLAFGPWQLAKSDRSQPLSIRFSSLMERRKSYERVLLRKKSFDLKWQRKPKSPEDLLSNLAMWGPLVTELELQSLPVGFVRCVDIDEAVRATVFLNKFEKLPFRRCAREGCPRLFPVKYKYKKKYCAQKCAHLEAVIKYENSPKGRAKAEMRRALKKTEAAANRANRRRG